MKHKHGRQTKHHKQEHETMADKQVPIKEEQMWQIWREFILADTLTPIEKLLVIYRETFLDKNSITVDDINAFSKVFNLQEKDFDQACAKIITLIGADNRQRRGKSAEGNSIII